jgi:hypothetical protein
MTVSDQIIAVIEALCEKFGVAIDWTAATVMPYVEELAGRFIQYEIRTSVAWMVVIPLIAIAFWAVVKLFYKKADENHWDDDDGWFWAFITALIFAISITIAAIIVICVQTFDIIEAITIPEKTIIDYISTFMN